MSSEDILKQCKERMEKSLESLKRELSFIRTGRAHPSLLDQVKIDLYGQQVPVSSAATVNASDAKTLLVTVWDVNNIKAIDSAIRTSNLSLNPRVDGNKLFISLPELTAERRQDMIKIAKKKTEDIKIGIRNIRRDSNDELKKLEKNKEISEDQLKDYLEEAQGLTGSYISQVEKALGAKQVELEKI